MRFFRKIEDIYYDLIDKYDNLITNGYDRLLVLTKHKKRIFIKKYITRMEQLITMCKRKPYIINRSDIIKDIYHYNSRYYKEITDFIFKDCAKETNAYDFINKIIELFKDDIFLNAYIKKFKNNIYAFYFLRGLKRDLKWSIRWWYNKSFDQQKKSWDYRDYSARMIQAQWRQYNQKRHKSASLIQNHWRHVSVNPRYKVCRMRLMREFNELM